MVELRYIVNELMEYQLKDYFDEAIAQKQRELSDVYDTFTANNGLINNKDNEKAFSDDSAYYLLCSLENVDEDATLKVRQICSPSAPSNQNTKLPVQTHLRKR